MTDDKDELRWRMPAQRIGVSRVTVNNAERGRHALSAEPLLRALILGGLLDELH
jgi:DNA-binding XRE family transcriptional regulator